MKKRAIKVAFLGGGILLCGLLYGLFCMSTGVAIPCFFRKVTGFSCPGCGVSRMCINLMRGNIPEAIRCNRALFFCMFPLLVIFSEVLYRYIKVGDAKLRKWENVVLYGIIVVLLLHGVARNVITF